MSKSERVFVDADSILYKASCAPSFEEARISVLGQLKAIREACLGQLLASEYERQEVYAEWPKKGNFRRHIAITKPYKGNRQGKPKPEHLEAIREWFFSQEWSKPVYHMESEDAVSIRAHAYGLDRCTVACIDKDLHQIPANFYDYSKKDFFYVSPQMASRNLYGQIITGDSTDNIPGIPGKGPAFAAKQMDGCSTELAMARSCADAYRSAGFSWAYMLEQARLIYILRSHTDVFQMPEGVKQW